VSDHPFVRLAYSPFRTLDRINALHAAHAMDTNRGDHAGLTRVHDCWFGALEAPAHREAA
jgi:hypothetical protein